ncbi:MAG: hypothetical protein LBH16_01675 [Treponema sp.]|jgi:hypothetical protein|nr:hypothetical protein [Treponema sp.]
MKKFLMMGMTVLILSMLVIGCGDEEQEETKIVAEQYRGKFKRQDDDYVRKEGFVLTETKRYFYNDIVNESFPSDQSVWTEGNKLYSPVPLSSEKFLLGTFETSDKFIASQSPNFVFLRYNQ